MVILIRSICIIIMAVHLTGHDLADSFHEYVYESGSLGC